jgi:predicted secreted Zn-dependent protease
MLKDIMPFWPVLSFLLNGLIGVVVCAGILKMREVARAEVKVAVDPIIGDVADHETRIIVHEGRITELEKDVLNLPTKQDIARVEGKVEASARELGGVAQGVRRLETFAMQQGAGARV